jgi:oxygen-independent coproporphyrinogen-3 oxidase
VFFGGGTPSLLPIDDFRRIMTAIRNRFEFDPDAEVTTEANPESVDEAGLNQWREMGINRLSLGMQSSVPDVLRVLDRVHTPGRVQQCLRWARAAGFDDVSLDLIYGAPGESMGDWSASLAAAVAMEPDHVSAYSLIVEEGTPLARRIARGELASPDDDEVADKYLLTEEVLNAAGFRWYEVSNWARCGHECRHNLAYWRSKDWWGLGAGAHSHVGHVRWWNQRRPASYVAAMAADHRPSGQEELTVEQVRVEQIMLGARLAQGFELGLLNPAEVVRAEQFERSGHLRRLNGRLACTLPGRLIADGIVREILD